MGKIYSNLLHFLSYLLKCPVNNAGNGISEPLNIKIFQGSMPPDGEEVSAHDSRALSLSNSFLRACKYDLFSQSNQDAHS